MSNALDQARSYLGGEHLLFSDVDKLWRGLKKDGELSIARAVLECLRVHTRLRDELPSDPLVLAELCREEALLTSKDPELGATMKHRRAIEILKKGFPLLYSPAMDPDGETLGIAGGILKRQWEDLGQYDDLRRAADFYRRAAGKELGDDAYPHINAAFLEDLLASRGDDADARRLVASDLRKRIVAELRPSATWFNAASRAEAHFGLGQYSEAESIFKSAPRPDAWKLQTTTRQLATLAHLREEKPLNRPEIRKVFDALLPQAADAVRSAFIGKVGLALSGGGFRASFYHLGVLARLAEINVLRHVDVLSCVSGGSVIGACYWLALRERMQQPGTLKQADYVALVLGLIAHFKRAVAIDLRAGVQPSKATLLFKVLVRKQQGAMDPEETADALEEHFFRPLCSGDPKPAFMDELPFKPGDHNSTLTGSDTFNPTRHNWLRANKVPSLVLNATTVNTGRGWQFTPTWMGESPWELNEGADNIERLEWAYYNLQAGWRIRLARAVAASASVPGIFAPLELGQLYQGFRVQLVDGGVYDNQGVLSLLATNCNVLLVSDASGQLLLQRQPPPGFKGLGDYVLRAMDVLMERVRQTTFGDLTARRLSGMVRGLMFLHMKAGLDADTVRLPFSQESFEIERSPLSPSGVRKDFQRALAELRTDLDAFTETESDALMACGYQMAAKTFQREIAREITELAEEPHQTAWPFAAMLTEITSTAPATAVRSGLLDALREGSKVKL